MRTRVLQIHPGDDVLVALTDLRAEEEVSFDGIDLRVQQDVRSKHKVAVRDVGAGETVRMYGVVVGRATRPIPRGGILTTENLRHEAEPFEVRESRFEWSPPDVSRWRGRTFDGIHRPDGRVGTANHWLVVPLVFCENRNVEVLRHAFVEALGYGRRDRYADGVRRLVELYQRGVPIQDLRNAALDASSDESASQRVFPNVDGIKFLTHTGGCGGTREDAAALCELLAAYIDHPNVAGATVLSLGCQNAQLSMLEDAVARRRQGHQKPLIQLEQQRSGTEKSLMDEAIRGTFAGLAEANDVMRAPAPVSHLVFGVECGGSDGFSGITANPAIGRAADLCVALGGTVLLSEFPELCGVEQELIDRSVSVDVAARFAELQRTYAARAEAVGSSFDMNPSPGNIRDGLITDAMKSAGAARKGGTSPVVDVLDYTQTARRPGLNLVCTPGNDVESTTALAAAGANVVLFSTGLGTPTGNPIVPVIKISTNTPLARRMPDVIDLDAGGMIEGEETLEEVGARILDLAIEVASGRVEPAAVRLGQDDFIPWKRGISL